MTEQRPMVGYDTDGDGPATFERSCPKCGRLVRADENVTVDGRGQPVGDNATCKRCGRVAMPFVGYLVLTLICAAVA